MTTEGLETVPQEIPGDKSFEDQATESSSFVLMAQSSLRTDGM